MHRREQFAAGGRQFATCKLQAIQAALEAAEVLHAGNDFLAGVAALLEADAAEGLQVEHLRNEQFAGGAEHLADAGADLGQQPVVQGRLAQLRGEALPQAGRLAGRCPQLGAAIAQAHRQQFAGAGHALGFLRQVEAEGEQGAVALAEAEAHPGRTLVGQLGLEEHRVFLQVGQLRLHQLAGHGQGEAVGQRQDAETGDHPSLGRAARAEAAGLGVEIVEVAGQLALEELGGVLAVNGEDALVVEQAEKSGCRHRVGRRNGVGVAMIELPAGACQPQGQGWRPVDASL
ncbi:hypothetical protein D3C81_1394210 [compost metagenome]